MMVPEYRIYPYLPVYAISEADARLLDNLASNLMNNSVGPTQRPLFSSIYSLKISDLVCFMFVSMTLRVAKMICLAFIARHLPFFHPLQSRTSYGDCNQLPAARNAEARRSRPPYVPILGSLEHG
jgi:hypothetical protein